jgi:hypothetical protein
MKGTSMRAFTRVVRTIAPTVVTVLLLTVPARGATGVITTKADEFNPAATDTYIAWNVRSHGNYIVYAKEFGGTRFRVNPKGTQAWVGSIDGTTLIYQQYVPAKGRSDVYSYDLSTKTRSKVGAPVSTDRWEYDPVGSGDWLMYARWYRSEDRKIFLYNTNTHERRTLAETSGRRWELDPTQINGNYAVWVKFEYHRRRFVGCNVFLYDIGGATTTKLKNPNDRCQYAAGVNAAGTVFFARSGMACGNNVVLRKQPLAASAATFVKLADDHDVGSLYAVDKADTTTDVYYGTYKCGANADIVKVNEP